MKQHVAFALCLLIPFPSWAISKLHDSEVAAIFKDGKPCFYLTHPIEETTPSYLQGSGIRADVYSIKKGGAGLMWHMWMRQRPAIAPTSPETCLPYGTVSPDKNRKLAEPLKHDEAYSFALMGEYGRNMTFFCIHKDAQGKDYLSKSDHQGNCQAEPLLEQPKASFWQKLFGK